METKMITWEFECPKCGASNKCLTNITQREIDDKYTEKRINTAVGCGKCGEVTIIDNLEEILDFEFDWKNPMAEKPPT